MPNWETYINKSGRSPVRQYELKHNGINVKFKNGGEYFYPIETNGTQTIGEMMSLADNGEFLARYLNKHKGDIKFEHGAYVDKPTTASKQPTVSVPAAGTTTGTPTPQNAPTAAPAAPTATKTAANNPPPQHDADTRPLPHDTILGGIYNKFKKRGGEIVDALKSAGSKLLSKAKDFKEWARIRNGTFL